MGQVCNLPNLFKRQVTNLLHVEFRRMSIESVISDASGLTALTHPARQMATVSTANVLSPSARTTAFRSMKNVRCDWHVRRGRRMLH